MKYAIVSNSHKDIIEYSVSSLREILRHYGHSLVMSEDADIIGITVCDVNDVAFVRKLRDQFPSKKIAIGGHAAVYYKLFLPFVDFINIGHGFEFFRCQSIYEITALNCVVSHTSTPPYYASEVIDWTLFPIANVTKQQRYYVGAFGCKNKCKFCLTSWTHKHQRNPYAQAALAKYPNITLVSNDSEGTQDRMTQSITATDFIKRHTLKKYGIYRIGIEFATEQQRKKYGKPFDDALFIEIFKKAIKYGVRLKLFCISGISTKDEWDALFSKIPTIYSTTGIEVKFTNLNYEMFVPLRSDRENLSPDNFFDSKSTKQFISRHKMRAFPLKSMPCMSPLETMRKTALCWSCSEQDMLMAKKFKDADEIVLALKTHYFKQDYSNDIIFDLKTTI
jgi:hypothetical protein